MKTRGLILGFIFVFLSLGVKAQVYEMFYQGFEEEEEENYTIVNGGGFSTTLYRSGSRSFRLPASTTQDIEFLTDTIDFTWNSSLTYITLEFDHILNVAPNAAPNIDLGLIFVKRASQSDASYTQLTGNHYVRGEGASVDFPSTASFSRESYEQWQESTMTNSYWKKERFDLNNLMTGVAPEDRKLIFRFVLKRKTNGTVNQNMGWWLDNIRVRASQNQMVAPTISMLLYPDGGPHPSSRGARVMLDASTTVPQGINADSVYLYYRVGSRQDKIRLNMSPVQGYSNRYTCRIPFEGYDTLMHFYCVVKDATSNFNESTFPASTDSWVTYWCTRGRSFDGNPTPPPLVPTGAYQYFPFPPFADSKSEWVIDSALMANSGYGPGAITKMNFTLAANTARQTRTNFQFRMKNIPTDYTVPDNEDEVPFTSDYLQVVWDSTLVIEEGSTGGTIDVRLQDTFFYAGKDILMQVLYNDTENPPAVSIKTIPAAVHKRTLFHYDGDAWYNLNAYTSDAFRRSTNADNRRPAMIFEEVENQILEYDAGVSALTFPNSDVPMIEMPSYLEVELKNFGESVLSAATISYNIDDSIFGSYDWNGSLSSGSTAIVRIENSIILPPGYHTFTAWVEDTIGSAGTNFRDHEPANDTSSSPFIVCGGALAGVRQVGGENADYNDIEEFLFSLSRCGVGDSLVVKLAAGEYPAFSVPHVDGLSAQHYVVFEPLDGEVTLYADATTGKAQIANLVNVSNFRFRDIRFVRRGGALSNMVLMGASSDNCRFDRCEFIDSVEANSASMRITSLIGSGFANSITVDKCLFIGGNIGVDFTGQAIDLRSTDMAITNSEFHNQYTNAIRVQNLTNVRVQKNEMYDVMSNSSYVLLVYACHGNVNILANKLYTSHGAGAVGISDVHGTQANHAKIANNMAVCNDEGLSNQLTTTFNVIQGSWIDAVYNSIKMTAPNRTNVAAATFGGGQLENCRFVNNIIATYDNSNFAFSFPGYSQPSAVVGHNIYYSASNTLLRRGTVSYRDIEQWYEDVEMDTSSRMANPAFLNGSLIDLRTFSRLVRGVGTPIAGITTDIFDSVRDASHPCPGAFEFVALFYDFEPEALVSPLAEDCMMPENVELQVLLRNSGVSSFVPGSGRTLNLKYQIDGGAVQTYTVTQTIPAGDTITIRTGRMLQLPPDGMIDREYRIDLWIDCANDPNQINDTNHFTVLSRYHQDAPLDSTFVSDYSAPATLHPTAGISEWTLYSYPGAPKSRSNIYWYYHPDDEEPFMQGPELTTSVLRMDTAFYIRQRRELPIVRITQVQIKGNNNAVGLSNPMPSWINNSTKLAVQLTNIGDDTAFLAGDTLIVVSPTTSINNKYIAFTTQKIAPGEALVVQYVGNTSANPQMTVHTGSSVSVTGTTNFAVIYRHGGKATDVVPFNNVITTNSNANVRWATQNVPVYVWNGDAIAMADANVGGVKRISFNGDATDWVQATAASPMEIGNIRQDWIRFTDNGCETGYATLSVQLENLPPVDLEVEALPLPSGCDLGEEAVSMKVVNFGATPATGVVMNYSAGGAVVSENYQGTIGASSEITYTFNQMLNLSVPHDSVFNVKVWVSGVSEDTQHFNDTSVVSTTALYSPGMPQIATVDTVQYGQQDTLSHIAPLGLAPIWYDANHNPIDTGAVHITERIYSQAVVGMGYVIADSTGGIIGTGASRSGKTAYPSPYQPNYKFAKQQYIYSPHELRSLGLLPGGEILSIAFRLDSMYQQLQTVQYGNYTIAMALSTDTIFPSTTSWANAEVVYQRPQFTINRSQLHTWITHSLDTPFRWDGEKSLVVQVTFENSASVTTGVETAQTTKTNTTLYKAQNSALSPSVLGYVSTGTRNNKRPDIKITQTMYGCYGPIEDITIVVDGIPDCDVKLMWPEGHDTVVYTSCGNVEMDFKLTNLGQSTLNGATLKYSIDGGAFHSTTVNASLQQLDTVTATLFSEPLKPGRHSVIGIVDMAQDATASNDTIRKNFSVRFCGQTYMISSDSTLADYFSFGEALDSLNVVGISGPVVFSVDSGVYVEQVEVGEIPGASRQNKVTFRGVADTTVLLTASTSQANNFVVRMDGAAHVGFENMSIVARPTASNVNYANAVVIQNSDDVSLRDNIVRVKGTINNANASAVVLQGNVSNLLLQGNWIDSGYYSVKSNGSVYNYSNITLTDNRFTNFWNKGIELQGVNTLDITRNTITSGVTVAARGLVGISLTQIDTALYIQKNHIYLFDQQTGAKQGIFLSKVHCSTNSWGYITNNMIGAYSVDSKGGIANPGGIIMTDCQFMNVIFNSIRVKAGTFNKTYGIMVSKSASGVSQEIKVLNNIVANYSSLAYFVQNANMVGVSDNNNFFSEFPYNLASWGGTVCEDLSQLQIANEMDGSSMSEEPYFNSWQNLHLMTTNFVAMAQYNTDVTDDIDGNPRSQLPGPTIGAHEMTKVTRNVSVIRITSPVMPTNLNIPNDIETDPVIVRAEFYNNGSTTDTNSYWYAYIEGHEAETRSADTPLGAILPDEKKVDFVWLNTPLGLIDTQMVRVVLVSPDDEDTTDNELTAQFYLAPAFDLEAQKIIVGETGCSLQQDQISIQVKNVGYKSFPDSIPFEIGFHTQAYYPSYQAAHPENNQLSIYTMPDTVRETVMFDYRLGLNQTRTITFTNTANLYPTDTSLNIKVRLNGWVRYVNDVITNNDSTGAATSSSPVIDSYYTPAAPVGNDTTLPYATWGEVTASQENSRPIRWYRDTTASPFYSVSGTNITAYNNSCRWSTTPQFFHDSIYYLQCFSDKNCPSSFSVVHVHVDDPVPNDIGVSDIITPLGGKVYTENDTVRVAITNYGTSSQSNFPVTYQLRKGDNTAPIQTVTETCTASIAPGDTYIYKFDSLMQFIVGNVTPITGAAYKLRAWTDLENDAVRRNDTIRTKNQLRPAAPNNTALDYSFSTFAETTYPRYTNNTESIGIDIVRVSFNEIEMELPPLGRSYNNMGAFPLNNTVPEWPVLHVSRGTADTITIEINSPEDPYSVTRGRVAVYIDFNRNGSFNDEGETVVANTPLYSSSELKSIITIPASASYGYMKMRVAASVYDATPSATVHDEDGHLIDFLLYVDPEPQYSKDLSILHINAPRERLIREELTAPVSFRMANRGSQTITSADLSYVFEADTMDDASFGEIHWTGSLAPGQSTLVTLPEHTFTMGTTVLKVWHSLEGDENPYNDTLTYEYHRFHRITVIMDETFDSINWWYAPVGYNQYTKNVWQCGTPNKTASGIRFYAFSEPNAWATNLTSTVVTGTRGNVSYLYSPIVVISRIRPDTISFYMAKNLSNGSTGYIEFYNYDNAWQRLDDTAATVWYNDEENEQFTGNQAYRKYWLSSKTVSGDYNEFTQFRFVYTTPQSTNANAAFGNGFVFDDFHVGRAQRAVDLGVVAITNPISPSFGQTIYPEVVVKNYGYDTVRSVNIGYIPYGVHLAKETTLSCFIEPGGVDTLLLDVPFVITKDYPDTFSIAAFTYNQRDIYNDNDTLIKEFVLTALDDDIGATDLIYPRDYVIAGDSVYVTLRVHNYGNNPLQNATFSYILNENTRVEEEVDFMEILGRPLASRENFNYTYKHKFRASMGSMTISVFVQDSANAYVYNDTISKRFNGISAITDVAAAAIVLDTSAHNHVKVQLVIENRGARGVNDFEVGFWYDNDSSTMVIDTFHRSSPMVALSRDAHLFDVELPAREAPYDSIMGYVRIANDNDPTNDTTSLIERQYIDIEALNVLVEENSNPDCRVFFRVRNNGNLTISGKTIPLYATINGNSLSYDVIRTIMPGQTVTIEFDRTIPKDPSRRYSGNAWIDNVSFDSDHSNNQTTNVSVVNYVEGVPTVNGSQLVLGQNYPNPFSGLTTVPFTLPNPSHVSFFVMDAMGKIVQKFDGYYPAGDNSIVLSMDHYSTGVYYYGIVVDGVRQMRKMIVQ